MEPDAFAAAEAERWATGLAAWGQDGARIARLRDAADIVIYTPGSAGRHSRIGAAVVRGAAVGRSATMPS